MYIKYLQGNVEVTGTRLLATIHSVPRTLYHELCTMNSVPQTLALYHELSLCTYLHIFFEVAVQEGLEGLVSLGEGVLVEGRAGLQDEEGGLHHVQLCLQQVEARVHCLGHGQRDVDIVLQHRQCHDISKGERDII